ncbi:MAG: hypothetical protein IT572_09945 [Deltaproteobacteria bacterium]|nr:hypothetical protein [Deltaproteobacteria bacterium]
MKATTVDRGDSSLYSGRSPSWKIDRGVAGAARGLPVRSLSSQTREGFYAHRLLGGIETGTVSGPKKLQTKSAEGLAVKSAGHLAVKSAAPLKK